MSGMVKFPPHLKEKYPVPDGCEWVDETAMYWAGVRNDGKNRWPVSIARCAESGASDRNGGRLFRVSVYLKTFDPIFADLETAMSFAFNQLIFNGEEYK